MFKIVNVVKEAALNLPEVLLIHQNRDHPPVLTDPLDQKALQFQWGHSDREDPEDLVDLGDPIHNKYD